MIKDFLEGVFGADEKAVSDFLNMDRTEFLAAHKDAAGKKYDEALAAFEMGVKTAAGACAAGYFNGEGETPPVLEDVHFSISSPTPNANASRMPLALDFSSMPPEAEQGFQKALDAVFAKEGVKVSVQPSMNELRVEKIFAGIQADGPDGTVKTFHEMKEWVENEGLHDRGVLFETVSRMIEGAADFGPLSSEVYDEEIEYENGPEERMDISDSAVQNVMAGKVNSWKEIQDFVEAAAKERWNEIAGEEVALDETREFESPDGTVHDWYGRYVNFKGDERLIMEAGYGEVLGKYLDEGPNPDATSKYMERFAALKRAARERDEEVFCYLPAGVLRMSDDKVADWMVRKGINLPYDIPGLGDPMKPLQARGRWDFSEEEFYKFKNDLKEGKASSGRVGSVYFGSMCAEFVCEEPEKGVDFNFYVLGEEGEGERFGVPYSYHSGERLDPLIVLDNGYEAFKRLAGKEVLAAAEKRPSVSWAAQTPDVDWSDESSVNEFFEIRCGFTDDEEKMRDFREISKEEFLSSYDYLSESEYEATERAVEREWKQEVQEFLEKEWSKPEYKGEDVPQVEAVKVWHPQEYGKSKNECLNLLVQLKSGLGGSYSEEDIRQIIAGSALGWRGEIQETTFQPVLPEESGTFDKYLEDLMEAERENKRELAEGYANEVIESADKKAAEKFPLAAKEEAGIEGKFETVPGTEDLLDRNIEDDDGLRSLIRVEVKAEPGSWLAEKFKAAIGKGGKNCLDVEFNENEGILSVILHNPEDKDSNAQEIYATGKVSETERKMVEAAARKIIENYLSMHEKGLSVKEAFFTEPKPFKVYRDDNKDDPSALALALNAALSDDDGPQVERAEAKAMLHYMNAHGYSLYAAPGFRSRMEFFVLDVSEDFNGEGRKVESIQDLLKSCHDCLDACEEYDFGLDDRLTKVLLDAFVKFDVRDVMEKRGLSKAGSSRPTDIAAAIAEETQKATLKESVSEEYKAEWLKKRKAAAADGRKFDPFQATKEIVELWNSGFRNESLDVLNDWLKEKGCVSKEGFERLFKEIEAGERKAAKKPRKKTKGSPERGV